MYLLSCLLKNDTGINVIKNVMYDIRSFRNDLKIAKNIEQSIQINT